VKQPRVDVVVIAVTPELAGIARRIVAQQRRKGIAAESPYGAPKLVKALKAADAAGARQAIIVGPEEWKDRKVVVRELDTGAESAKGFDEL
jgi:histidyl-tRNA synthetase